MQKELLIIRHAKAKEMKVGQADFDRKLSKKGISHAHMMSQILTELSIIPDKIYSSPARRTTMTAEIFAENLNYPQDQLIFDKNIYEAGVSTLLEIVNQMDEAARLTCLVGHNPGLTLLADYLCDSGVEFIPTCGMAYLKFEVDSWQAVSQTTGNLIWLKTPKMI